MSLNNELSNLVDVICRQQLTKESAVKLIENKFDRFAKKQHFAFKKWIDEIVRNPKVNTDDYKGFNDQQLWDIFIGDQKLKSII